MYPKETPQIVKEMILPVILDAKALSKFTVIKYRDRFGNMVYQIKDRKTLKTKYIVIEKP